MHGISSHPQLQPGVQWQREKGPRVRLQYSVTILDRCPSGRSVAVPDRPGQILVEPSLEPSLRRPTGSESRSRRVHTVEHLAAEVSGLAVRMPFEQRVPAPFIQRDEKDPSFIAVSYTHLTLPTSDLV